MLLLCHPLNSLGHNFHLMPITQKFCFYDGRKSRIIPTQGCVVSAGKNGIFMFVNYVLVLLFN